MLLTSLLNENFNYMPLNELYFGRKPLAKLKEKFDVLYKWCKDNRNSLPYREKFYMDFVKEVSKTFGMSNFRMVFEALDTISACTYAVNVNPDSIKQNTHFYAVNSELGLKFNTMYDFKTVIMVQKGVFTMLTADEAFAIILHEIGHSFEAVIRFGAAQVGKSFMEMSINAVPVYETTYANADTVDAINNFVDTLIKDDGKFNNAAKHYDDDVIKDNKKIRDIFLTTMAVSGTIRGILSGVGALVKFIFGDSRSNDGKIINTKSSGNEYFCDSFAVMYGYGKEINSVNLNLNSYNEDSFICAYYDFIDLPRYILNSTTHPTAISRAKASIAHLRFELKNNKNLDASEKKNIEDSIKDMEATIDKYLDNSNGSRCDRVIRIGNKIVERLFGNKISKDLKKADYDYGIKLK